MNKEKQQRTMTLTLGRWSNE